MAIIDQHVLDAGGQFAADGDQLVAVLDAAVAHDDVFGRHTQPPGIAVAARFDGDRIVALVEHAIFDQYVLCHFRVDAIVIMPVRPDLDAADDDIPAQKRVQHPKRAIFDADVLDQHMAAAVELDKLRPQIGRACGHLALRDRRFLGRQFVQRHERVHVRFGTLAVSYTHLTLPTKRIV